MSGCTACCCESLEFISCLKNDPSKSPGTPKRLTSVGPILPKDEAFLAACIYKDCLPAIKKRAGTERKNFICGQKQRVACKWHGRGAVISITRPHHQVENF